MSRKSISISNNSATPPSASAANWLSSIGVPILCFFLLLCVYAVFPRPAQGARPYRIAVAPFSVSDRMDNTHGDSPGDSDHEDRASKDPRPLRVATALSRHLADRPIDRVIAPGSFVAKAEFDPPASRVRQWAYNASVDTVIVGRLSRTPESDEVQGWEIEIVVRSGHSGAEKSRHKVIFHGARDLDASADRLAAAILLDLGYAAEDEVAAAPFRDPRSPEPPVLLIDPSRSGSEANAAPTAGSKTELARGLLRKDLPIEIKADEAEIVDRGVDRKLLFQHNVKVRQGNVRLESDRVEAEYREGESEPDRLIAKGSVYVDQGYRRAKCDRAIYLRVEQTLSCEGRAELVQGCDVVRGDAIRFDLAGDRAHVIGAASIVIRPENPDLGRCATKERSL